MSIKKKRDWHGKTPLCELNLWKMTIRHQFLAQENWIFIHISIMWMWVTFNGSIFQVYIRNNRESDWNTEERRKKTTANVYAFIILFLRFYHVRRNDIHNFCCTESIKEVPVMLELSFISDSVFRYQIHVKFTHWYLHCMDSSLSLSLSLYLNSIFEKLWPLPMRNGFFFVLV